jgi:hypothetical protein
MSKYRAKQTSNDTSRPPPVAFQGAAPATPRKSSTLKQPSVFPSFSQAKFEAKMNQLYGRTGTSHSEGTVEAEFKKYVSGTSPDDMDILHFWEVSLPFTPSGMNATNSDDTGQ